MPAVTSPRGYPYPLDGDPQNTAGDIQKLAVKIDDDVTAALASAASGNATNLSKKYDKTGGTISGSSHITGTLIVDGATTINDNAIVTGTLRVDGATTINDRLDVKSPTVAGVYLSDASNVPGVHFNHYTSGEGFGSIRCASGDLYVDGDNDVFFRANNVAAMALVGTSPFLLIGKTSINADLPGVEIYTTGDGRGRITTTASDSNSYANLICRHTGEMAVDTKLFHLFQMGTGTAVKSIGSISQVGTSAVKYNTTSDYRLKDDLGPVVDPVGKVMSLQPKHLRAKADLIEYDGFIAHEVDAVVPIAVSGAKDAVLPPDDEFDPGGIDPQQLDRTWLIPIVVAALQDALGRIAALEAAP